MRKISIYPIYRTSLCIQQLLNEVCQSSNHQCTFVTICSIQPRCWEYAAKINGQQLKIFSESVMVRLKKNDVPLITWIVIRCFFLSLLSAALFFFNVSYVLSVFFLYNLVLVSTKAERNIPNQLNNSYFERNANQ